MAKRHSSIAPLTLLAWTLFWAGAVAAGWFLSDFWRNLLVDAYESRRERLEELENISHLTVTSPRLQRQLDNSASLTETSD